MMSRHMFKVSMASCALGAVILLAASAASAQTPPSQVLTLPALLKLVAERSPRLAVEQVAIDVAEADRVTAGAFPNPHIAYGRFRPGGGASTLFTGNLQQQTTIDLPLLITGQRGARIDAADLGVAAARARFGAAGNDLGLQAAQLFNGLQAAQEKAALLQDAMRETQRIVDIVSGRLQAGAASRYDLARVEVELEGLKQKLADARGESADRAASLATLLGLAGWRPVAEGTAKLSGVAPDGAALRDAANTRNAQLVAARRDVDLADAAVRRTEAESWPVPVLSLGRTWTSEPFGAANFIGLSAEIPLPDARYGAKARAGADLRAAQRRLAAVEAELGGEIERVAEGLRLRADALAGFQRAVAERMPTLRQMSEDAYRLGRAPILDMLDAGRSRLDALLTELELRAGAAEQELRLLALTGRLGS